MTKIARKHGKRAVQNRALITVNAIVEAAAQFLRAGRTASLSTNHIARRAGVSIGSLYQYFPNKEAILMDVIERESVGERAELERLLRETQETVSAENSVRLLARGITHRFYLRRIFNRAVITNYAGTAVSRKVLERIAENEDRIRDVIEEFVASRFGVADLKVRQKKAFVLLHGSLGILRAATFFGDRGVTQEEVEEMITTLARQVLLQA